mmetsp:Transcript_10749/g.24536  ORF Transcript_10749/g.24536 Transcript_10749/m.24536 type:complete len:266 (-) Transcript_10749:9-806(-)
MLGAFSQGAGMSLSASLPALQQACGFPQAVNRRHGAVSVRSRVGDATGLSWQRSSAADLTLTCSAVGAGMAFAGTARRRGIWLRAPRLKARLHAAAAEAGGKPAVELTTTRVDYWTGGSLVLFVRASKDGVADLGRLGKLVDKEGGGGALKSFMDSDGFDASPGKCAKVKAAGKGLEDIILVGLGKQGETGDWQQAGETAGTALAAMQGGSAALVCIDGVDVEALVAGAFSSLSASAAGGPAKLELLGAYPPGSLAAVERAAERV